MKLEFVNIIDAIQYAVDKIAKQQYKNDTECPPKFTVSQLDKYDNEGNIVQHEIILTVDHCRMKHTRPIFPRLDYKYGYVNVDLKLGQMLVFIRPHIYDNYS
jgi:hypothetical protein